MVEEDYRELLDFERSDRFTDRQKAALLYTSMLVWNPEGADYDVWARLRQHFTDEQIVELGSFVCLTYGQQRVIKTWGVGHGEFLAETTGGLATKASLVPPPPGRTGSARASVGIDRSTPEKSERRP